ncbi:10295_t:CDS:2 [Gigaspora margarita]|uniref:10295_t:CDS:1 n=1 Tax=Gigaspora margarita TaxID=4874 RepID=A0ABM8W709_GIGMA|nr:10295_t:CDS:2 [Gigaspora margarita]
MEEVVEDFIKVADELEHECQRNIKKMKRLYKKDQNKETEGHKMQVPEQDNFHIENAQQKRPKKIEESQYIEYIRLYENTDHNQETIKIEVEDQSS